MYPPTMHCCYLANVAGTQPPAAALEARLTDQNRQAKVTQWDVTANLPLHK